MKMPKFVLIFDKDEANYETYHGILDSSGFIVECVDNINSFSDVLKSYLPDIVVINGTQKIGYEKILLNKDKFPGLEEDNCILLIEKISVLTASLKKKLKLADLEEFPLNNFEFLKTLKKHSTGTVLPDVVLKKDNCITGSVFTELKSISLVELKFSAPVKVLNHGCVKIKSPLLDQFGIVQENFEANANGEFMEKNNFSNKVILKGLSVDMIEKMKQYINSSKR